MEPTGDVPSGSTTRSRLSERASRFFSNPAVGIIGSLASIVGLILAVIFYVNGLARRDVVYAVYPQLTYVARAERPSDLRVEFRGVPITAADVLAVQVGIWNQGSLSVRPENLLEPLQLTLTPPAPVLEVSVVKLGRPVSAIAASNDPEAFKQGRVPIHVRILERGDGANIQIIFAGRRGTKIQLGGIIEGQGEPRNFSPASESDSKEDSASRNVERIDARRLSS